jgi:hypothetical protein
VDIVGRERATPVEEGALKLNVSPDVLYVRGVAPGLAATATSELRADRWPKPAEAARNERTAPRLASKPVIDGNLDDWAEALQLAMLNPKVAGNDPSGVSYLAWDDACLYIAVDMRDNQVMNTQPRGKLYRHDSLEIFVSTEPRDDNPGYGPHDRQFFVTPESGEGGPVVGHVADREAGKVVDVKGVARHVGKTKQGWRAELAFPWSAFPGVMPGPGARLALELRVNDADKSHERWKIDASDCDKVRPADPTSWSILNLGE